MKRIFGAALLSLGLILAGAASADAAVLKGNPKSKVYHVETCQFYKGKGCRRCGGTGYKGRIGIYEIVLITEDIAKMIFANENSVTLREFARRNGMRSLRDDALRKVEAGISTLEEVLFVTLRDEE